MPRKKGWGRVQARRLTLQKNCESTSDTQESQLDHDYTPACKRAATETSTRYLQDHAYVINTEEGCEQELPRASSPEVYDISRSDDTCSSEFVDETCLGETVDVTSDHFDELYIVLKQLVKAPFIVMDVKGDTIKIVEMYEKAMKLCVNIKRDLSIHLYVHNREVERTHYIFHGLFKGRMCSTDILQLLQRLRDGHVCIGNPDPDIVKLLPAGSGLSVSSDEGILAYLEQDFGASHGILLYNATIRASVCQLLILHDGVRCVSCSRVRSVLRSREYRRKERALKTTYLQSKATHNQMDKNQLFFKLNEQKNKIKDLNAEVSKLRRQVDKLIRSDGIRVDKSQSLEFADLMSSCDSEVTRSYPDANSFQRLFWEQQIKEAKSGRNGMRWHPMIVRWCLYLRQTSNKCYEALRQSGFLKLPSSRTLFDYSHHIKSGNGISPETVKLLIEQAKKCGLYEEEWKSWVGLLFDEIHVKSDLVYDKHSGELVGYIDLDSVGNQILQLQQHLKNSQQPLAKSMLVFMVRGLATNLQFPLACYATDSITAEFLYPIVWKTIMFLEKGAKLKVLCVICDGASANRKFFALHKEEGTESYSTINPHSTDRKVHFISDVPHLIKTTRNCFSNSFWHKNSRMLWNNGKDISWRHIVRMYEEHCENSLFTPCPKLTYSHINLTAFSVMKVNLAAQVLSRTVANSLEMFYGEEVSETVRFVSMFDKFFDCLNVRNLYEGRNKRNENLNPYTSIEDARLVWLEEDFLGYLEEWNRAVMNRAGRFTTGQRSKMMLSHQTLTGISFSVKSIVQCVKVLITSGASFVLTHSFNQDPLEQHFGHYRHKG